jgi:pimeloyl-ACP methyl ester carboxylesterase
MTQPLAARRVGLGPPVILVHGGVEPEITWELQAPLAERWTLITPWRRGFPPSPPAERQDYLIDARDLGAMLIDEPSAHLVAFSYGAVGATLAAAADPARVRSLTLVEPALFGLARGNPEARELERLARHALSDEHPPGDPVREQFFAVAGLGGRARLEQRRSVERIARGLRFPGDAEPDVDPIRSAGIPCLVVSGDHTAGIEAVCDEVAARLDAERELAPGAGHAVPRASGFNERLEPFLARAERRYDTR